MMAAFSLSSSFSLPQQPIDLSVLLSGFCGASNTYDFLGRRSVFEMQWVATIK
jgi:hypothetical protein